MCFGTTFLRYMLHVLRAKLLSSLKFMQNSIQSFQKALQLNNRFYPTYYQLAEVYLITNSNLDEALRLVELANQQTPTREGELLRQTIAKKLIAGRNSAR